MTDEKADELLLKIGELVDSIRELTGKVSVFTDLSDDLARMQVISRLSNREYMVNLHGEERVLEWERVAEERVTNRSENARGAPPG